MLGATRFEPVLFAATTVSSRRLERYWRYILNYFNDRISSGFVEGLNNKIKTIKRRCYGINKVSSLFQRIWLDLQGRDRFFMSTP